MSTVSEVRIGKCYSLNGEEYYDLDNVMDDLMEEYPAGAVVEIYEADAEPASHKEFMRSFDIIEKMQDRAYDNYGEWAEDYLDGITKEQADDLKRVIIEWFDKNVEAPSFCRVFNERKINVTVEE